MSKHTARTFAIAALVLLSAGPASAEPRVQVFAIRGFAGVVFSRGMNGLCEELASIPEVACTVEDWYNATAIEGRASAAVASGQALVLIGHSLGAHVALQIADSVTVPVPLIVTIDANWFGTFVVPANAVVALNYYQNYDVLGRATLQPPTDFRGEFHQYLRNEPHVMIDASPEIHSEIIERIKAVVASLNKPPPPPAAPRNRATTRR